MSTPVRTILLGPQRDYSDVRDALDALDVGGPVALVTAGWQENEREDGALTEAIGRPAVNLALHERSEDVFLRDPALGEGLSERQNHLKRLQQFYRVRLEFCDDAARAIAVRHVDAELLGEEADVSVATFRHHDQTHVARCLSVRSDFEHRLKPHERPAVVEHMRAIDAVLADAAALVIGGGQVASLINRLKLFRVIESAAHLPVVAWSAGAMSLTDRVVLFHDFRPNESTVSEVLEHGLARCPGVVVLPDASSRVDLDDHEGIGRFAMRFGPARCFTLDSGDRLTFEGGAMADVSARELTTAGTTVCREAT
jgi:hypothetical protein